MRDYQKELEKRVAFIQRKLEESHASGIVFGNSGGKDCALVGILCKKACENTVGILLPCTSRRNYEEDLRDGTEVNETFGIETRMIDMTPVRSALVGEVEKCTSLNPTALSNIAPRLRMTALYAVAAAENRLVAGTGNRDELYLGYYTKWGDGGSDFNPIADLTVGEVYEFLAFLGAPMAVRTKAPSAALYEGQTDEADMGVTYAAVDRYLLQGEASEKDRAVIERYHARSEHKRRGVAFYSEEEL